MKLAVVKSFMSKSFASLGRCIARNPYLFVVIPVIIALSLATGFINIKFDVDMEYLFSPIGNRAVSEKSTANEIFPMNRSINFDILRITDLSDYVAVIVMAKDGKSMLRKETYEEFKQLDKIIKNITVEKHGRSRSYKDICARSENTCHLQNIFMLERDIHNYFKGNKKLKYPVTTYAFTNFITAINFGGVTVDDSKRIVSSTALRLLYFIDNSKDLHEISVLWQNNFISVMKNIQMKNISITWFTAESMNTEFNRISESIFPYSGIIVFFMISFSILSCMSSNLVKSKPWLGLTSGLSAFLAVMASFGLLLYCGVKYIDMNISILLFITGIGMDDSFVLLASWRRTDSNDVEKRMSDTFSEAGVSITITSLTNLISFLIGYTLPYPATKLFCAYMASGIAFTYVYQVTFFGACLALSGYREGKKLHPFTFRPVKENDTETTEKIFFIDAISERVGNYLQNNLIKTIIILCTLLYLAIGSWRITKLKEGLYPGDLIRRDSFAAEFIRKDFALFQYYDHRIQIIINKTLDYSNPVVQNRIESIIQEFESNPYVSQYTESWLRYYIDFSKSYVGQFSLSGYNMSDKQDFIDGLRNIYLRIPQAKHLKDDIVFNADFTEIIASRFFIATRNVDKENLKDMVLQIRAIADTVSYPITVQNIWFIRYESFLPLSHTAFQIVLASSCIVIATFYLLTYDFLSSICLAITIISVLIGLIGYMELMNERLNFVTVMGLIVSSGFSIDYCTHVSYIYLNCKEKEPNTKLKIAIRATWMPIIQGYISTVLGLLGILFVPINILLTSFKVYFLVLTLAVIHGLIILPVCLNVFDSFVFKFREKNCIDKNKKKNSFEEVKLEDIDN